MALFIFSHITVGVRDLGRAGSFYDALLAPLGLVQRTVMPDEGPPSLCWHRPSADLPRFYASIPLDGKPSSCGNGTMVAFLAPSVEVVIASYAVGLASGGTDEGAPGLRLQYAPDYFGAYLRDPDGNKIHIVHRPQT